jgi:hypothetical protein
MRRLDVVTVELGEREIPISWDDAMAMRRELGSLGFEALKRAFADAGASRPVRVTEAERRRLLAAVERVERPSSRLDVLREALQAGRRG